MKNQVTLSRDLFIKALTTFTEHTDFQEIIDYYLDNYVQDKPSQVFHTLVEMIDDQAESDYPLLWLIADREFLDRLEYLSIIENKLAIKIVNRMLDHLQNQSQL